MSGSSRFLAMPASVMIALLSAPVAAAQSIDYDTFQQMFREPVTAAATGKPQRVSQAPVNISIITHDDILHSGLDNIPDILRFVAGLDVRTYGQADAAVGIRGYNSALNPAVLVLLDGRQVYSDDYGMTIWSAIPVALSEIQQIEIIKGPNAALYGFNAVSGVINIVTRNPMLFRQNSVVVEGGTQNQALGEAVATIGRPGAWGVRLTATGSKERQFRAITPLADDRAETGNLALDGRFRLDEQVELDLSGSLGKLSTPYEVNLSRPASSVTRNDSLRAILQVDTRRSGLWRLDAYRNGQLTDITTLGYLLQWRQTRSVVALSDLLRLGTRHTIRPALEYRDTSISSLDAFQGRVGYRVASGSLMWNWDVSPRLSLTNAIRVDALGLYRNRPLSGAFEEIAPFSNRHLTVPGFNSGLVYKLTADDIVRVGAGRATRLPSLIDLGGAAEIPSGPGIPLPVQISGDSRIDPTTLDAIDIDYDRRLPQIDGTLRASVFASRISDIIGSPLSAGFGQVNENGFVLRTQNYGSSSNYGGEVTLDGKIAPGLHGKLGYAFSIVDASTRSEPFSYQEIAVNPRQVPTHVIVGGLDYRHGRWSGGLDLRWQSAYIEKTLDIVTGGVNSTRIGNYVTANVHAGVRIGEHLSLNGIIEQFNANRLVETGGIRPVERRALISARLSL